VGGRGRPSSPTGAIDLAARAAVEANTFAEIGEHVMPHLQRAAGATSALLYRYDEDARLVPIAGPLRDHMDGYARHYLHSDPVQAFPRKLEPRPRVVLATQRVDPQAFKMSAAYNEFYSAFDLEHLACAWLTHVPYASPGMAGLLFARPPTSEAFDAQDQRMLARALPGIVAAVARSARLSDIDLERDALEALVAASGGPARIVLSTRGKVIWASPAVEPLLDPRWRALGQLREAARRLGDVARGRVPATVAPKLLLSASDRQLEAHLSLLRTASGAPLILAELAPEDRGPEMEAAFAERYQLTRAESVVLHHVARGLTNGAIAARLHVSIETVRTHVRRILGKLGVASRVEAALMASRR
jgi:DNA-binding CsgD family transcriptional regulator